MNFDNCNPIKELHRQGRFWNIEAPVIFLPLVLFMLCCTAVLQNDGIKLIAGVTGLVWCVWFLMGSYSEKKANQLLKELGDDYN